MTSIDEAEEALNNRAFTLEADQVIFKYGQTAHVTANTNFVSFKYGQTAHVTANTNFVSVKDDHAVVQTAFNIPVSGPNGLGGVTVEGIFSDYELKKDKKGNISLISARVDITLYEGSNKATVSITPNFNSNRMTLNGVIVPIEKSSVFKGRSL